MKHSIIIFLFLTVLFSCKKSENPITPVTPVESMYYPPLSGTAWETKPISSLGWKQDSIQPLKDYLVQKNTKSFMIIQNGRIVMEEYFGGHTSTANWEWNSAGKTLVSATIGIAQQESIVNINNKVSNYLGTGWTSMPLAKENMISVKNLLTMTSGNDDTKQLVTKANLTYVADAGTRWAYSNIFQRLINVVDSTSKMSFETYFNAKVKNKIGMDGYWNFGAIYTIYNSTTRSMARFGLLALNKGKWENDQIINEAFFNESINTSQSINPSYGYLWWLNGKTTYMVPNSQTVYPTALISNAPADMYSAMGAKDNRIYVIPSKKMVVIRMGNASDPANPNFALSGFDNELWEKINAVIK